MSQNKRRSALGRGLNALIPMDEPAAAQSNDQGQRTLSVDLIDTTVQPRVQFNAARLEELAESIRTSGILQPLLVRSTGNGRYSIIAGERRFRASGLAGLTEVPVVIRDATTAEAYELALVENIQREDLDPIEEALAYRHLVDNYRLTQERIAQRVGKDRATIANALRLLKLPESVQTDIVAGELSAGHARAILSAPEAQRIGLAQQAMDDGWSVRETERQARARREAEAPKTEDAPEEIAEDASPELPATANTAVEDQLRGSLGAPVRLVHKGGKGRLEIRFHSLDELDRLIELLNSLESQC
jgi:ParB family transcriptional regulator, chromosome partitioning protein